MEIYSKKRKCKKCGSMGTADAFRLAGDSLDSPVYVPVIKIATEEMIRRKCLNCGFRWSEKPLA